MKKPEKMTPSDEKPEIRIRPMNDMVLVVRLAPEEKIGLLFIPDTAQKKQDRGKVVAVGPGAWAKDAARRLPMAVRVGDVVELGKYSGAEVEIRGERHLFVRETEIVGVVEA